MNKKKIRLTTGKKYQMIMTKAEIDKYATKKLNCNISLLEKPKVTEIAPSKAPCGIPTNIIKNNER